MTEKMLVASFLMMLALVSYGQDGLPGGILVALSDPEGVGISSDRLSH